MLHLALLLASLSSRTVPADGPQQPLRLEALVAEALRNNPEIEAARERYEASRRQRSRRSSLPDPVLSLGYTSVGSPRPFAGIGLQPMANAGVMFTQEFPAPGKRRLESQIALQEAYAEFDEYQGIQLELISRVKQAYYRLYYAHAAAELLERNRDLLEKLLRITEARYAVGRAAQQDVFKAQTEIGLLEARLERLAQERRSREAEINSLLARPAEAPLGRPQDPTPKDLLPELNQLLQAAQNNAPLLSRDEKRIARAELALNLARKDYYPDLALSGGYFNMGAMGSMYMFRADFKLPLYYPRKQRPAMAERLSLLRAERRGYEADVLALRFRIQEDYLLAQTSARLFRLYAEGVVPQAALTMEASLAAYETGAVDFLTVLNNFRTLLEYELNYYEELANYYVALSRLEASSGEALIR